MGIKPEYRRYFYMMYGGVGLAAVSMILIYLFRSFSKWGDDSTAMAFLIAGLIAAVIGLTLLLEGMKKLGFIQRRW